METFKNNSNKLDPSILATEISKIDTYEGIISFINSLNKNDIISNKYFNETGKNIDQLEYYINNTNYSIIIKDDILQRGLF